VLIAKNGHPRQRLLHQRHAIHARHAYIGDEHTRKTRLQVHQCSLCGVAADNLKAR
jgi:hypothetical protein